MKKIDYYKYGKNHPIELNVSYYMDNGNLAIQMITHEDGYAEPWSTLTTNIGIKCRKNCAYIDTNNNGDEILEWIEENNLGKPTGGTGASGYCLYPEYEFNEKVLMDIGSSHYKQYLDQFK